MDLGTDFDLYIGILWKRFCTPTDDAGSGTEEEFNIAYDNFLKSPHTTQILFYFCNIPFTLDEINLEQLQKVQQFKDKLKANNILFKSYKNLNELAQLLRMHIPFRLNELGEASLNRTEIVGIDAKESIMDEAIQEIDEEEYADDDRGILEYKELFDSLIEKYLASINRISKATNTIGTHAEIKTKQLVILQHNPHTSTLQYRSLFRGLSKDMDKYTNTLEAESKICFPVFSEAMNAALQLLNLSIVDDNALDSLKEQRAGTLTLYEAMDNAIQGTSGFLQSVQDMPKMTTELNKSKKRLVLSQQAFINSLMDSKVMVREVIDSQDKKIGNLDRPNAS
jgi:hypothetical protein